MTKILNRRCRHTNRCFEKVFVSLILALIFSGCVPNDQKQMDNAMEQANLGHSQAAVELFEKIIVRFPGEPISLKAATEAAKLAFFETKNFKKSAEFQKYIVLYSDRPEERFAAQRQIADIYFTQLNDYPQAVIEINKLLAMTKKPEEKAKYKMNLARAYYYQNNFSQAQNEADEFLRQTKDEKIRFDLLMLKGNIALAEKDLAKAIDIYKDVLKTFPKRAEQENVALTAAVCYEELKDYKNAISMLEILRKTHPVPEYIDVRIKRLVERQKNAPGAKGMKK